MSAYPTLAGGEVAHLPFTQQRDAWNITNRQAHGYQYSYNVLAAPLGRWEISYLLTDADLATLQAFWESMGGRYGEFSFTDPDTGDTASKCRFDQDEFSVQHLGPDENRVSVTIKEYA